MQEKIKAIEEAMGVHETNKDIYIIKHDCKEVLKNIFTTMIYDDKIGGTNDVSYEIANKACETIVEAYNDNESMNDDGATLLSEYIHENYNDLASVYTTTQLGYLNLLNHEEVADIMRDYECNIPEACAYWYTEKVLEACRTIIDKYLR